MIFFSQYNYQQRAIIIIIIIILTTTTLQYKSNNKLWVSLFMIPPKMRCSCSHKHTRRKLRFNWMLLFSRFKCSCLAGWMTFFNFLQFVCLFVKIVFSRLIYNDMYKWRIQVHSCEWMNVKISAASANI